MELQRAPRGDERLIYFADSGLNAYNLWEPVTVEQFARHMDDFADNGVDVYSQLTFAAGAFKPGLFVPEHPECAWWTNEKLRPLIDSGVQPLEVMIDQAHRRGMKFFCKLRLTDWHRLRCVAESGFIVRHPELQNPDRETRRTLDFTHAAVRDFHADLIGEMARRFDIDGITLNFTRGLAYFPKDARVDRHALLTAFVRQVRGVLDEQGRARGRNLQLNVIVWPHLEQCACYGADVAAWIGEDLVDHVCPGNTAVSDPAMDHEAWSSLCRSTNCGYFPMLQPTLWQGAGAGLIGPDHIRALARGMYDGGADGISVFNWQHHWDVRGGRGPSGVTHGPWSECRVVNTSELDYPLGLARLRPLRDPGGLDAEPRKYYFRSMDIRDELSHEVFEDAYRVVLPRRVGTRGAYRFRLPEDLDAAGGAWLVARILGLAPLQEMGGETIVAPHADVSGPEYPTQWPDAIAVDVNGVLVPLEAIQMAWHRKGRAPHLGRPLEPYTAIWFRLTSPPARRGPNVLGITPRTLAPLEIDQITIEEVEVVVMPRPLETGTVVDGSR